jgi:hypothetical protein
MMLMTFQIILNGFSFDNKGDSYVIYFIVYSLRNIYLLDTSLFPTLSNLIH